MSSPSQNDQNHRRSNKVGTMDPAHVMDYAPLNLGHPPVSKRVVDLVDLEVNVFGLEEIANSTLPIAILIIAHGFANRASQMAPMAYGIIGEAAHLPLNGRQRTHDLLVVTLDQRNHGARRRVRNGRSFESDPARLINMAAAVTGGRQDHQLIIDYLPAYLFPQGERVVDEFMSTGISLGGHVTWRLLREDPRVKIGVPIITVPSEAQGEHLLQRAVHMPVPTTYRPPAVDRYYFGNSGTGYAGKKILSIHGGLDALIPPSGAVDAFEAIKKEGNEGEMEMWVQEERGHVVTPEMTARVAEWIWRWGLTCSQ